VGLRTKTVLIIAATIILATVSEILWTGWFYRRGIAEIEEREAREALLRATSLVADDLDQLDILVRDWAFWDDTYEFVQNRDERYVSTNFSDSSFAQLEVSSVLVIDDRGSIAFMAPRGDERYRAVAAELGRPVPGFAGRRGFVLVGGSLQLAVARPVLRSDTGGKPRGTLVMTRALDAKRTGRYSLLSGLPVSVASREPGAGAPGDVTLDYGARSIGARKLMPVEGSRSLAELRVSVLRTREGYAGGSIAGVAVGLALVVSALGMLGVLGFEAAVLGRMRSLGISLRSIAAKVPEGGFLATAGRDELTGLVEAMNSTLASLYRSIGERDVAVREVHHRVKNNLQVVASLISLQSDSLGGEAAAKLEEVGRRVRAIALVHEDLFVDGELEAVDARRLLERITQAARESAADRENTSFAIDCEAGEMSLERATPVSIIATEAIAEALSRLPRGGRIGVALRLDPAGGLALEVGCEAPPSAPLEAPPPGDGSGSPLSRALVEGLADQLGGRAAFGPASGGGSLFTLKVPPEKRPSDSLNKDGPTA
jgi:two-component sensor histidine kinase